MLYPDDKAVKTWKRGDLTFYLVFNNLDGFHNYYCGYARFPVIPVKEVGYNGFMTYVPVHGGLTYAEKREDNSMVYGFDCAHAFDEDDPDLSDIEWLSQECERMGLMIQLAAEYEEEYLAAKTEENKAQIIDAYRKQCAEKFDASLAISFGARLNLLAGKL